MNDSVRRYPRTLQEAFGPYTSRGGFVEERWCWFRQLWRLLFGDRQ